MDAPSGLQKDFSSWVAATRDPSELKLGIAGFRYEDLFAPARLAALGEAFDAFFRAEDDAEFAKFDAYRASKGAGLTPEQTSEALLAASPFLGRFVAKLFCVEADRDSQTAAAKERDVLWHFKKDFAKKRLFKASAGKAWTATAEDAARVAKAALVAAGAPEAELGAGSDAEEMSLARAALRLHEMDDTARKAAKAGGVKWTDELHTFARAVRGAIAAGYNGGNIASQVSAAIATGEVTPTDEEDARIAAFATDAVEAWLHHRRGDHHDAAHGFELTDRRMNPRQVESEVDYCLYCHDRDKDSCSKGLRDAKTGAIKPNPLGVPLNGCPLDEKISEAHTLRRQGDAIAALALVAIDNPMLPGTGHRICNDCMKACIFQKQEPVNIPADRDRHAHRRPRRCRGASRSTAC